MRLITDFPESKRNPAAKNDVADHTVQLDHFRDVTKMIKLNTNKKSLTNFEVMLFYLKEMLIYMMLICLMVVKSTKGGFYVPLLVHCSL